MSSTYETLDERIERFLGKEADKKFDGEVVQARERAREASARHPALARKFGKTISREQMEKEIDEW